MKPARSQTLVTEPGKPDKEGDAFTCRHCNTLVFMPRKDGPALNPGQPLNFGWCGRCDANICGPCCDEMGRTLKCVPFERKLDIVEGRARFRRSLEG